MIGDSESDITFSMISGGWVKFLKSAMTSQQSPAMNRAREQPAGRVTLEGIRSYRHRRRMSGTSVNSVANLGGDLLGHLYLSQMIMQMRFTHRALEDAEVFLELPGTVV
jgi:hypothetical protein